MAIDLRSFTTARVALGRTGHSLPTAELLRFRLDHARARDAVYEPLDAASLGIPHILIRSAAPDRATYLRRPDLGRQLAAGTRLDRGDYDAAIVIADGLSAPAIHHHAPPLLDALLPKLVGRTPWSAAGPLARQPGEAWHLAPICVAMQARVAIGDEIGERLGAKLVVVLIGERPGLTSPDSLGVYVTWDPRPGRTDAERNCISNVRAEGLSYPAAAELLCLLMNTARSRRLTGVTLQIHEGPIEPNSIGP
jgi:ethanolamine ammonia-lyase small subunit